VVYNQSFLSFCVGYIGDYNHKLISNPMYFWEWGVATILHYPLPILSYTVKRFVIPMDNNKFSYPHNMTENHNISL